MGQKGSIFCKKNNNKEMRNYTRKLFSFIDI